jgi:DNA-directed RNA polymerase specialized sigma24 family protein
MAPFALSGKLAIPPISASGIPLKFQISASRLGKELRLGGEDLSMSSPGSVSQWLGQLQAGDVAGAQPLWQRYFQRLVGLARKKLHGNKPRLGDEEDIALSAFHSFCRAAEQGRFPQLSDRKDLWQILVMLTARKAWALVKHEGRQKRGGDSPATAADFEQIIGREPSPEFAAQIAEEFQIRLDRLKEDDLRKVALWKLEGYTNEEIAAKFDCVVRTVERKLWTIRRLWESEDGP